MGLSVDNLRTGLSRIAARIGDLEDELNAADAKLGDGDTGVMLRRVFEKVAAALDRPFDDLGAALHQAAIASAGATGSSLGTLITVALLSAAKRAGGMAEIGWTDLGEFLLGARDAMMIRGRATLGDKTVLDSVDAAGEALKGADDAADAAAALLISVRQSLDEFRQKPCRVGRARMFSQKSVGLDDPGMLAFTRVIEIVLGAEDKAVKPDLKQPAHAR